MFVFEHTGRLTSQERVFDDSFTSSSLSLLPLLQRFLLGCQYSDDSTDCSNLGTTKR